MKKLFIVLLLVMTVGCAKKYTKPAEKTAPPEAPVKEEVVTEDTKMDTMRVDERVVGREEVPGGGTAGEGTLPADDQVKSIFRDVLFDYDKYDIKPDARPALDAVAAYLGQNKNINIVIEGHCDDRGTNEYNLALGERRAKSAKNYLTSLGVSPDRMIVITFGEEKPLCTAQNEACWQQNRRAHFVIVKSKFQ